MKIKIAWIGKTKEPAIQSLTDEYLKRIARYADVSTASLKDEVSLLNLARGERQNEKHRLILLDSRGKQFSSEELAAFVEREQAQALPLLFAVGGTDGFSQQAREQAAVTISLGKITLPHELARIVLLEQLYRAFTILTKHPYHLGH
jgi:23S rRNA (pseudouridine1915-N3)-methyltransferase